MAEQIKFGDRLFLTGEKLVLDNGDNSPGIIMSESGTIEIEGNLIVTGDTTTVNSLQTSFADPKLLLNGDLSGAPTEDVGIEIGRGTSANKFLTWNETDDKWTVGAESFVAGTFEGNLTGDVDGNITSSGSTFSGIDINGGTIDGTPIGATTPAAGNFTLITGDGTGLTNVLTNYNTDHLTEGGVNLFFTNERVDDRIDALFTSAYGITGTYNDAGDEFTLAFDPINAGSAIAVLDTTDTTQAKFRTIREGQVVSGGHGDLTVALSGDEIVIDTSSKLNELAYNSYTGNGSISIYTLPYSVTQDWQVLVYIDGEVQHPVTNYAISGTTLTLTSPLLNNAVMNVIKMATNSVSNTITDANTLGGNLPNHYLSWAQTTGTPTTIAGYGITDGYTDSDADARAQLKIDALVGGASAAFDTLVEIQNAMATDTELTSAISGLNHDTLSGFVANEHIDWTSASAGTINPSNYSNAIYTTFNTDFDTRLATKTTADLSELTNKYFTDARARQAISVSGDLSYNSTTGVISSSGLASSTTDDLAEGSTNLYYTDARADARIDNWVGLAPTGLDTLVELSTALGNDVNFSTTITNSLANKEPTITAGTTAQYWRGDKSFQTLDTSVVTENTNLYYTDTRVRGAISVSGDLSYNSSTGVISTQGLASSTTDDLAEGSTNLYYTDARWNTKMAAASTSDLSEGTNLYYTTSRANTDFDTRLATKSTTNLAEGSNLYYTDARAQAVSINNLIEDTTPQLGGNLDLNTFDLSTTDPTVSLTTTLTSTTAQGTVGASSETNLSNTAVTVNTDDSDVGNAVSSYITLSSTEITNLGFEGDISLTYFGAAAPTSNFVWRDAGDSAEQNDMVVVYSPPSDEYTFTLPTNVSLPTNSTLPFNSLDNDIYFKQYAYGEMTVTSATTLTGSTIQLKDASGFYIDKEHVTVTSLGGTSYKVVFWTHDVSVGDVIDVIAASAQTATFEWGTSAYSETGLTMSAESFSLQSSTNDIFAMGDLEFTLGLTTGEVVGTFIFDEPTGSSIISGLTTVTIDGTSYLSAHTITDVPIVLTGNASTSNEVSIAIGGPLTTVADARLWLLDSSGDLIYKFPATDGTANQVMKTDGSGDISWTTLTTDDIGEGSTNLYYTNARADARAQLKIDALVDSAPAALDTLNELAAALGDDANHVTTITNLVSANTTLIGNLTHDGFTDFVANEHIDWTSASAGTIHASNYIPDQTVSLTGTGATTVTGTYPTFTIDSTNSTTDITGSIIPATDNTYDLGSTTKKYSTIYGYTVEATYADIAERYATDVPYEVATVVVFGGEAEITTTTEPGDVSVAGVISTNPALKLNADAGNSQTHPYVALKGRVPCKLIGPVSKGDLIVTADNEPGYAQSIGKNDAGHSVFAKSIETDLTEGKKLIEVVIL